MATVNTNDLRIQNAQRFSESTTGDSLSYVFVGRVQPWADENAPPVPQNNFKTFYNVYDNLFALNKIIPANVYYMIPRVNWSTGVTYDYYRQDYSTVNRSFSGSSNLYDCVWIVRNQQNNVYVCLDNNKNTPSTVEPLNTGNAPFLTSDGYQWQRVYNLNSGTYNAYKTDNFMPIEQNDVVVAVDGDISTVIIENDGNSFTNNPIGAPNQIPFYYCGIDGDGTGAVAKVTILSGRVDSIEVVRAGSGYTYGTLNFTANNCYENLPDYDRSENPLNPGGDGTFRSTVIVPPPGGWGTDLQRQLGGTRVGVFSSLNYNLFNYFNGSFRQVGILQNVTVEGEGPSTVNGCYAIKVSGFQVGTSYISGEEIQQIVLDSSGSERLAKGIVISFDSASGVIRYSQNSTNVDADGNLYRFDGDKGVLGKQSNIISYPQIASGTYTDIEFIAGYATPDVTPYSGYMTYLANVSPVVRDPNQTERISLLIAF